MRLDHDVLPHGLEHAEREKTPVVARLQADLPVWARVKETGVNTTEPCRQYTLTLGQALMPAGWSVERRIMRHACGPSRNHSDSSSFCRRAFHQALAHSGLQSFPAREMTSIGNNSRALNA